MKKPKKKKCLCSKDSLWGCTCGATSYNFACNEMKKYYKQEIKAFKQALKMSAKVEMELAEKLDVLPSEEEIQHICKEIVSWGCEHNENTEEMIQKQTKTISKRISGEKKWKIYYCERCGYTLRRKGYCET